MSSRAALLGLCSLVGACATLSVGSGEVAIVRTPSGMDSHVYTAGDWHIGGDDQAITYSVRSQEHSERLEVQSSDGLGIVLDTSIRYHVVPGEVVALDQELGPSYYDVLLGPTLKSQARRVVGKFKPEEIYSTQRDLIERQIREGVENAIKGRHIELEAVLVRNVTLPPQLQAAITEKLEAEQAALEQKSDDEKLLDQARAEAERKKVEAEATSQAQITAAQGAADAARIAAQAAADAKRLDAQATDDYQRIVAQHLNAAILKLREIEATKAVADSPNAKLVLMGQGAEKTVLDMR